MSTTGFISVSDKVAKQSSSVEAVDLGTKLQSSKLLVLPREMNMMMMLHHDNYHHHRPFPPYDALDADDHGPTSNNNNSRPKTSNISDVFASTSSNSGAAAAVAVDSGGAVSVRTVQPFDIFPSTTAFKSPEGGMSASLEFPFTNAQWKELQRQAMIYKYFKASIPVPPHLLIPITTGGGCSSVLPVASYSPFGGGGALNLRFSSRGDIVEPGRCRRTDGKKWRCSRDVAPDQKYCERHMHRGRPRSRKPVELIPNKKKTPRLPSSSSSSTAKNASPSDHQFVATQLFLQNQTTCFLDKPISEKSATFWPMSSVSSYKEPRNSDWIMTDELVPLASSDQQWQHLMQIGPIFNADNSSVLNQHCGGKELLNLNLYESLNNATENQQVNSCPFFLNSEIVPLEKSPAKAFIDAWSTGVSENHINANNSSAVETSVPSNGKLSVSSSLSLSMGFNSTRDDEMGPTQMGLGLSESDDQKYHEYASKSHGSGSSSSWLAPVIWAASTTPGGPLAEVLRPSNISTAAAAAAATEGGSNPSSPVTGNGSSCSPQVTAVSSPSGVLQRTLASLSDSSGSSSPTLSSSIRGKTDISLMWLKGN